MSTSGHCPIWRVGDCVGLGLRKIKKSYIYFRTYNHFEYVTISVCLHKNFKCLKTQSGLFFRIYVSAAILFRLHSTKILDENKNGALSQAVKMQKNE
jgi:hypothetical protein